jgi:hypothetical protein
MTEARGKHHGDHYDYQVRQWILDSAITANKKGTNPSKILQDAQIFYGFVFPDNGEVKKFNRATNLTDKGK